MNETIEHKTGDSVIKDSGKREEFQTGSRRDTREGKGRFDLFPPLATIAVLEELSAWQPRIFDVVEKTEQRPEPAFPILRLVFSYMAGNGGFEVLREAAARLILVTEAECVPPALVSATCPRTFARLALLFENGAKKYGENNWTKGQPQSRFLDSAMRHLLKHIAGERDESHDIAAIWNLICAVDQELRVQQDRLSPEIIDVGPRATRRSYQISALQIDEILANPVGRILRSRG